MKQKKSDRRELGWLTAGMLSFLVSSSAWAATDYTREIGRQEADAAHVLSTLGRDKRAIALKSGAKSSPVQVRLIPRRR